MTSVMPILVVFATIVVSAVGYIVTLVVGLKGGFQNGLVATLISALVLLAFFVAIHEPDERQPYVE